MAQNEPRSKNPVVQPTGSAGGSEIDRGNTLTNPVFDKSTVIAAQVDLALLRCIDRLDNTLQMITQCLDIIDPQLDPLILNQMGIVQAPVPRRPHTGNNHARTRFGNQST